jgi:hypothetical protein
VPFLYSVTFAKYIMLIDQMNDESKNVCLVTCLRYCSGILLDG